MWQSWFTLCNTTNSMSTKSIKKKLFDELSKQNTFIRRFFGEMVCSACNGPFGVTRLSVGLSYLLSSSPQFLTLVFQSQVWRSISKASPLGQRTPASLVLPFSAALSHLWQTKPYPTSETNCTTTSPHSLIQPGNECSVLLQMHKMYAYNIPYICQK